MQRSRGFTLIELSIVLAILGLLIGGVLTGKTLIRAAAMRSVTADYAKYAGAYNGFLEKYNAMPGDMANATSYWGSLGGTGSDQTCQNIAANGTVATCNGNGDGVIGFNWVNCTIPGGTPNSTLVTSASELTRFWQHLGNAGLVDKSFSGFANATIANAFGPVVTDKNAPLSRFSGYYWMPAGNSASPCAGSSSGFATTGVNAQITISPSIPLLVEQPGGAPLFTPTEALRVDQKMDDGLPATGRVTTDKTNCTSASGVAPPGDANATYQVNRDDKVCSLYFDL